MKVVKVGLVADPASPTEIARRMSDLDSPGGEDRDTWDIEVVSEPFTLGCEDIDTALERLTEQAQQHHWDLVVGLTELPLRSCESLGIAAHHPGAVEYPQRHQVAGAGATRQWH